MFAWSMNGSKSSSEVIDQFPYPSPKSTLINALCLIGPIVGEYRFAKTDKCRVTCKVRIPKSMWRQSFRMDKVRLNTLTNELVINLGSRWSKSELGSATGMVRCLIVCLSSMVDRIKLWSSARIQILSCNIRAQLHPSPIASDQGLKPYARDPLNAHPR